MYVSFCKFSIFMQIFLRKKYFYSQIYCRKKSNKISGKKALFFLQNQVFFVGVVILKFYSIFFFRKIKAFLHYDDFNLFQMLIRSVKSLLCLLLLCVCVCISSSDKEEPSSEDPPSYLLRNILMCLRREYTLKAIRSDENGRTCWDFIRSTSCWGRCDSFEVNIFYLTAIQISIQLFKHIIFSKSNDENIECILGQTIWHSWSLLSSPSYTYAHCFSLFSAKI